jgi:hypothetical protein
MVATDIVVDVAGYFPAGSDYTPITNPTRILDTRTTPTGGTGGGGGGTGGGSGGPGFTPAPPPGPGVGSCQFRLADAPVQIAFCETFDQADTASANDPSRRSGDLNAEIWGVSRANGNVNIGQGTYENWYPTQVDFCDGPNPASPPRDVRVCNQRLVEATHDGGAVSTLAMYPKQPFDFTGRTGTVVFDVSNDSAGSHAAWPEFWLTDRPVPTPFTHLDSWDSLPQNGLGIRFAGCTNSQGDAFTCPRGSPQSLGVDSAVAVSNYQRRDLNVIGDDSVMTPTAPGQLNHYELRISQNQIDVWATDAFSGPLDLANTPLRHIATIANANLSLTKGLIWMEDVHYNANKSSTQGTHTFMWDNVGFDGPKTYRDLSFDVPDANVANSDGSVSLGYLLNPGASRTFNVDGVFRRQQPQDQALATFGWFAFDQSVPSFSVNGGPEHTTAWPFDGLTNTERVIAVPIPLSEVHDGTNTITFTNGSGTATVVHNINLILVAAAPVP